MQIQFGKRYLVYYSYFPKGWNLLMYSLKAQVIIFIIIKYTFRLKHYYNVHIFIYLLLDVVSWTETLFCWAIIEKWGQVVHFRIAFMSQLLLHAPTLYILYTSLYTLVPNTLYNIKQAYFLEIQYGYIVNFIVEESKRAKMKAQDTIFKKRF